MSDKKTEKVAEKTAEKLASEVKKPEAKKAAYIVAEKRSIVIRGMNIKEGKEIKAEWFPNKESFNEMLKKEYIVKC